MDPISIGALLASLGTSFVGGRMNAENNAKTQEAQWQAQLQQTQQQAEEAAARNAVRDQYETLMQGHAATNQNTLDNELASFTPAAQAAATTNATAARGNMISANIDDGSTAMPQLGPNDSPAVAKAFQDAYASKLGEARSTGAAGATLGGVGDTWGANARTQSDAGRNLGTENSIARTEISNLPSAQDFAGFQTKRIINMPNAPNNTIGNLLQGLGTLGGAVAGSGKLGSFSPSAAVSPWGPTNGNAGYLAGGKWSL